MPITLPVPGGGGATVPNAYYSGSNQGEYQFVSLTEIVDNFTAAYVGEGKILQNALKGDINYHAHRALQELSYDTLKSCKSIEVEVCANLRLALPHDYVNYVKLSWSDSGGIEHVLYPAHKTSNPHAIEQSQDDCTDCGDTSETYQYTGQQLTSQEVSATPLSVTASFVNITSATSLGSKSLCGAMQVSQQVTLHPLALPIDVIAMWDSWILAIDTYCNTVATLDVADSCGTFLGWSDFDGPNASNITSELGNNAGWSNLRQNTGTINRSSALNCGLPDITGLQDVNCISSDTWNKYSSASSASNSSSIASNDMDDVYFNNLGGRRGIDPQYAQANGSFFIDCRTGMIHFGSDMVGKTVILKYISDGHGTDDEMIIHKFAEEATYKWIAYGCLSARVDVPEYVINRFKKEKFAETRKAKIRLSNIKIEEITQIMRGKSKWIKH